MHLSCLLQDGSDHWRKRRDTISATPQGQAKMYIPADQAWSAGPIMLVVPAKPCQVAPPADASLLPSAHTAGRRGRTSLALCPRDGCPSAQHRHSQTGVPVVPGPQRRPQRNTPYKPRSLARIRFRPRGFAILNVGPPVKAVGMLPRDRQPFSSRYPSGLGFS